MRVVVVGGGLAGMSVAWHLREAADVVVLERASAPGTEASAQNAGMVRRMGEDPVERALALRTVERLEADGRFAHVSRVTGAILGLAHDRWHLHDAAAHLRARGVRIEAVDRPADLAPALAGTPVSFAWWLPDERVADPHALMSVFRRGVPVRCGVAVAGLVRRGDAVVGVRTAQGIVEADRVVLAAGAWAGPLGGRSLIPLRRTLVHTEPHPRSSPDHPWVWIDDEGVYVRPEAGGWLVSGCDEAIDPPPDRPGSAGPVEPEARARALDKVARWLPALADVAPRGGWSGLRTFAPDRRPLLGPDPEAPGLVWAAGLGGFGVTCALAVGEAVAAWVLGASVPWIAPESVSPGRPLPGRWPIRPTGTIQEARLVPAFPGGSGREAPPGPR